MLWLQDNTTIMAKSTSGCKIVYCGSLCHQWYRFFCFMCVTWLKRLNNRPLHIREALTNLQQRGGLENVWERNIEQINTEETKSRAVLLSQGILRDWSIIEFHHLIHIMPSYELRSNFLCCTSTNNAKSINPHVSRIESPNFSLFISRRLDNEIEQYWRMSQWFLSSEARIIPTGLITYQLWFQSLREYSSIHFTYHGFSSGISNSCDWILLTCSLLPPIERKKVRTLCNVTAFELWRVCKAWRNLRRRIWWEAPWRGWGMPTVSSALLSVRRDSTQQTEPN